MHPNAERSHLGPTPTFSSYPTWHEKRPNFGTYRHYHTVLYSWTATAQTPNSVHHFRPAYSEVERSEGCVHPSEQTTPPSKRTKKTYHVMCVLGIS